MASVLDQLPRGGRVAVIRLRSLGDCVLTTPALEILKRARPDLRVAVVVEDRFRAVFEGNPDIDRLLGPSLGALRAWKPELCLNLHGGPRSAWMTAASGARFRAGFGHFRQGFAYNLRIPRAQQILGVERKVHTAEHLASAMYWLGAAVAELPRGRLFTADAQRREENQIAVIHAVAATPEKTWGAAGFLTVAHHLRASGMEPVFIGAGSDDLSAFRAFRTQTGSLSDLKRLLASASLFIGNDSGPAHMAAAFGLPVVVIFAASDPEIWGPLANAIRGSGFAGYGASLERAGAAAGGSVKELGRLLAYAQRYWPHLLGSMALMAIAGAATSFVALLVGPLLFIVLDTKLPNQPIKLYEDPVFHHTFYLNSLFPGFSNAWSIMAFAIIGVFLLNGLCDYFGNYLVNFAGFSAVTNLKNAVFDKVQRQGAEFFEAQSMGKLMSSIMNDTDKVQVALSHILADLLRQSFAALGLLLVVIGKDWQLALFSLTVVPLVILPVTKIGRRIRRTSRSTQDRQAEMTQILQETLSGHMVVKAFGAEGYESRRFREASRKLLKANLQYVLQQALSSPLIEIVSAMVVVTLLWYARNQIKAGGLTPADFASFIVALMLLLQPIKRLVGIHNIFEQALGASQRVFEYLDHTSKRLSRSRMRRSLTGVPRSSRFWKTFRSTIIPARPMDFRWWGSIWK